MSTGDPRPAAAVPSEALAAFGRHLRARDAAAALDLAVRLAEGGVPLPALLDGLVGAAQVDVGERWMRDELSVADEHAATAISEAVVAVVTLTAPPPEPTGARVTVVCAEGEWHVMAARLTAEILRGSGCDVTFLGASVPAPHLARFLGSTPCDVVAVSCSTPLALDGVLRCVEVVHDAGIPVLGGGRAFGGDDRRSRALGVDLWAPSAVEAARRIEAGLPTELRVPSADVGGAAELALHREGVVAAAMDELARRLPSYGAYTDAQRARTREDFAYVLRFAEASVLTGDARLFQDFLAWMDEVLTSRGLPPGTVDLALEILRHVGEGHAGLVALLDGAASGATPRPGS